MSLIFLIAVAAASLATDKAKQNHSPFAVDLSVRTGEPREAGQSAYAALSEIVRMLTADPATDWTTVNIDALRRHLVDMDEVTLRSTATVERLRNGARFTVTGPPQVAAAVQRMTQAHFAEPDVGLGWSFTSQKRADGATVLVTSANPADAAIIQSLGFYGILTMGEHHQPHHLMMARGGMKH